MNDLEKVIERMDFQFFATGQHKVDPESFLHLHHCSQPLLWFIKYFIKIK
jgi:hypothetical protein